MAFDAVAECGAGRFRENLLFTHRGLSGPVILQVSSYWQARTTAAGRRQPDHRQSLPGRGRPPVAGERARSKSCSATCSPNACPSASPTPGATSAAGTSPPTSSTARSSTPSPPPSPAGRSRPTAPSATPRPKSPWAAWTRGRCRPRPWKPATCRASTSSAR
jgi:hypothetical protein